MSGMDESSTDPTADANLAAAETAVTADRDPVTGQWIRGNRAALGASGNAGKARRFREALHRAISDEDLEEAGRVLVALAKDGDVASLALLFAYTVGKPAQAELEHADERAALAETFAGWLKAPTEIAADRVAQLEEHVAGLEAENERLRAGADELLQRALAGPRMRPREVEVELTEVAPAASVERMEEPGPLDPLRALKPWRPAPALPRPAPVPELPELAPEDIVWRGDEADGQEGERPC